MPLRLVLAVVCMLAAAGCHDDACVWSAHRELAEADVVVTRDAAPVATAVEWVSASTVRSKVTDQRTSRITLSLVLADDATADSLFLMVTVLDMGEVAVDGAVLDLAGRSKLELRRGTTIVAEGEPSGMLMLESFAARCEFSDTYGGSDSGWTCGVDAVAHVDAQLGAHSLTATLAQRERLTETCHSCTGFEGCNF